MSKVYLLVGINDSDGPDVLDVLELYKDKKECESRVLIYKDWSKGKPKFQDFRDKYENNIIDFKQYGLTFAQWEKKFPKFSEESIPDFYNFVCIEMELL